MAKGKNPPHFSGGVECKIHTTRGGTCAKAKGGECNHMENTSEGFYVSPKSPQPSKGRVWEAHHILCISCLNGYSAESNKDDIVKVYRATEWCIHGQHNMIGLGTKRAFRKPVGAGEKDHRSKVLAAARPCHMIHHNVKGGYTDEVLKALQDDIWSKIAKAKKGATEDHPFTEENIANEFEKLQTHFRKELESRADRTGVTGVKGLDDNLARQGSLSNNWWVPFSMAITRIAKKKPIPRM